MEEGPLFFGYLVAIDLWPPLSTSLPNKSINFGKGRSIVPHGVATYKDYQLSTTTATTTGGSCNKAVTVLGEADHLFKAHQGEGTMMCHTVALPFAFKSI